MNKGEVRATDPNAGPGPQYLPRVDPDELACKVAEFWSAVHGETAGSMRLVSGFLIGRRLHGITRRTFPVPQERTLAAAWVAKEASLGRDVYMKPSLAGVHGGKSEVLTIAAEVDRSRLAILPRPSIALTVTATRVQCYWRLDRPVSYSEAGALVQRLMWSQDRPMVLPGMPDNRGFGTGKFECPECLPLVYSYEELSEAFPYVRTSGPSWEPGILRPVDLLAQRLGVVTAVFGGGALRAGMASAAAAAAALGGFLIPSPLTNEVPGPSPVAAADADLPIPFENKSIGTVTTALPDQAASPGTIQAVPEKTQAKEEGPLRRTLNATKEQGEAQVGQVSETDEVGTVINSGGEITRDAYHRTTGMLEGSS